MIDKDEYEKTPSWGTPPTEQIKDVQDHIERVLAEILPHMPHNQRSYQNRYQGKH